MSQSNEGNYKPLMPTPMKGKPVDPPTPWERVKGKVYALMLIVVILGAGALSAAAYNHAFDGTVPITLHADRAGLQMHSGNRVKIRGVDLGRVTDVALTEDQQGVEITLAVRPDLLKQIPDNATVSLEQLSAFGNKAIQVNFPANPSGTFLRPGSVIAAGHVSTEINSTFDELMTLLSEIKPSKLNSVLGGLANSLQDNGEAIGSTITRANTYLKKFNPLLQPLQRDWRSASGFADVYAGAGNSIADTISNAGVVADTISDKRAAFKDVVHSAGRVGNEADDFFGENAEPLTKMLKGYRPFTSLIDEYAPEITCFVDGMAIVHDHMTPAFSESGAEFEANIVQPGSTEMYHYPRDLPENGPGAEKGPNCRGLPLVTANEDSLADYTTGPPSLIQRTTDNSPRVVTNPSQTTQTFPYTSPLVQFFGPGALVPTKAPVAQKAGK
jgi:phospholipid/cholesterol/gamma-HCH transport system substrate-binding protein